MGWSTELFCNISFNKETFSSKFEVEDKIDEIKQYIQTCKDTLRDLAIMTEPEKMFNKTEDKPIYYCVSDEFESQFSLLQEYYVDLYKLELLLDNWDNCHTKDGLAIDPPDNIEWGTAYLSGDFIKSVKYPNRSDKF